MKKLKDKNEQHRDAQVYFKERREFLKTEQLRTEAPLFKRI